MTTTKEPSPSFCSGSPLVRTLLEKAEQAAKRTDKPILITGEVGVGKTYLASLLHSKSSRRSEPLQFIDCGSLSDLDNILFGHRAGTFTGAVRDLSGRLRKADRGTLVLDDFDRLNHRQQDQLHRVLVDGSFYPLGSDSPQHVDVRFIATTNKDIPAEVDHGRLKPDFVSRLDYFTLQIPALRERPEDIPELCKELLRRNLAHLRSRGLLHSREITFDEDCWPAIKARWFADNIRGLDKLIVRLIAHLGDRELITPQDIEAVYPALGHQKDMWFEQHASLRMVREAAERDYILRVCEHTHYNLRQAARVLDISPKAIYAKLRRYGIERP